MRNFDSLSREVLALAISLEEEDERVYTDYAEGLRQDFPPSAAVFDSMAVEEYPFTSCRRIIWLVRPLGLDAVRNQAIVLEVESRRFLRKGGQPGAGRRCAAAPRRPGARGAVA